MAKPAAYTWLPDIASMVLFLSNHTGLSVNAATELILQVFLIFCGCLLAGFLTRISTIFCCVLHIAFLNTGFSTRYGADSFTQMALFYALFFPLNTTFSIDNLIGIGKWQAKSVLAGIFIRLVQIQLCVVYLTSAIEKSRSAQWLNGEAIWRALMLPVFNTYNFSWLAQYPFLAVGAGYLVMLIEVGYAFFMWRKGMRVIWFFLVLGLHLSIALFMGLWYFSAVMIFLTVFAFGDDVLNDIKARKHSKSTPPDKRPV